MTKRDLIKWAEKEQAAAVAKAKEEAQKQINEIKEFYYDELGVNKFVNSVVPYFEKAFEEYTRFFDSINDTKLVKISKYNYRLGYYTIQTLTEKSTVKDSLIEAMKFDSNHEMTSKVNKVKSTINQVDFTYSTVIETLRNLPTAKDGLEYLTKLGFDVAKIAPEKQRKQLPATISVNVDTRYLILNNKDQASC